MKPKKKGLFLLLLTSIVGFLIFLVSLSIFNQNNNREPEAQITDGSFDDSVKTAFFEGGQVNVLDKPLNFSTQLQVLGAEDGAERWIEVDLTNQHLRAWEGNNLAYDFLCSTGKRQWGAATPVGVYRVWIKLRYTRMTGGQGSHYYNLPNVPCTQYFNKGYGIHGAYWHNNFGHPMSHGCVNLSIKDSCTLLFWTSPPMEDKNVAYPSEEFKGTKVVVHGETPWE